MKRLLAALGLGLLATPASAADATPPLDYSVLAMVGRADHVVQCAMALLAGASVLCWTIMLAKGIELVRARRAVTAALRIAETDAADPPPAPLALMRDAVRAELAAAPGADADGTKARLASRLHRLEMRLAREARPGTGILATIGAVGPFVGLFGTVWGIMNSFVGIARLHTSSLAVVAPGIAEALLATATGLFAAIPAVVIYNGFVRAIGGYRHELADLGEIVLRHASRDLDRGTAHAVRHFAAAE